MEYHSTESNYLYRGNVGIGLTNPGAALEALGTIGVRSNTSATVNSVSFNAGNTNTPGSANVNRIRIGGNDTYSGYLTIQGPGNIDYLTINGGLVGIGTTAPATYLDVLAPSASQGIRSTNSTVLGGFSGGGLLAVTPNVPTTAAQRLGTLAMGASFDTANSSSYRYTGSVNAYSAEPWSTTANGTYLTFNTTGIGTTSYSEKMRIDASGNVGIGTTTPVSIFQVSNGFVKASIGAAGGADLNYGTSYLGFNAARDASKNWQINSDGSHNGAGVIFGDVYGSILFAPITSSATGTSAQTLTDINVKSNIVMKISNTGNVGIGTGTTAPDAKLAVNGDIHATQVKVTATVPGPDYVFDNDYKLITLPEVKDYVTKNHHLPEIPSAKQMAKEGIDLGDMNLKLLKKVEELTLYLIDKDAKLQSQQKQIEDQQKINQSLQQQIDKLAKKLNN